MSANPDLFPETLERIALPVRFETGHALCQYGWPRVEAKLLPSWDAGVGLWRVGWLCRVDKAVDEWMPDTVPAPGWPWYRPASQPESQHFAIACAEAARAAKIVLEEQIQYAECDAAVQAVRSVQQQLEVQARRWLNGVDYNYAREVTAC